MIICQQAITNVGGSSTRSSGSGRCTMTARLLGSTAVSAVPTPQSKHEDKVAFLAAATKAQMSSPPPNKGLPAMSKILLTVMNEEAANEGNSPAQLVSREKVSTFNDGGRTGQDQEEEEDLLTILPRSYSWTARAAFHEPPPPTEQIFLEDTEQELEDDIQQVELSDEGSLDDDEQEGLLLDTLQRSPFTDGDANNEGASKGTMSSWNDDQLNNRKIRDEKVSEIHQRCVGKGRPHLKMFDSSAMVQDGWATNDGSGNQKQIGHQLAELRLFLVDLQ